MECLGTRCRVAQCDKDKKYSPLDRECRGNRIQPRVSNLLSDGDRAKRRPTTVDNIVMPAALQMKPSSPVTSESSPSVDKSQSGQAPAPASKKSPNATS